MLYSSWKEGETSPQKQRSGVGECIWRTQATGWRGYEGMARRYDLSYSREELRKILDGWSDLVGRMKQMFCFFNNCHKGSAAANALVMRDLFFI